ncbi:hypothetical protein NLC29_02815 [Candidatus Aminicenantes bacterium AH-873-B07]|nr:hypothetical protein [Candidatus Aminicenantes bacterium AH-873-B07]
MKFNIKNERDKIWILLFKIVLCMTLSLYSLSQDSYPTKEIQVVPLLNLNALKPKIDFASIH